MPKYYRSMALRMQNGSPATLDAENRSVEVIAATESPVQVYDYRAGAMVDEILLMSGLIKPDNNQVPLLDSHSRWDTSSVIGSFREMRVVGPELIGRAYFSAEKEALGPYAKVAEGHLTDFSVGFRIEQKGVTFVQDGESAVIDGRTFEGPVRVVTSWRIKELSVCPIGADENAKARAEEALPPKEESLMDKKLRLFLERQGLPKEATDSEAWEYLQRMELREEESTGQREEQTDENSPADIDHALVSRQAVREERKRAREIQSMCRAYGCEDMEDTLLDGEISIDEARQRIMKKDMERRNSGGHGHRGPIHIGTEEREKFRQASQDAIRMRTGAIIEKPAPGSDELAGRTLVELCRMALARAGQSDGGRPIEVIGRALTASEMPVILGTTANLSLQAGWETAAETWQTWCGTGSVSDFKTYKSARASETSDLDEVPESQEYKYGDMDEAAESYSIATYGKLFAITRQAIINDDIGALTDIPMRHGEAAARKVGDVAYAVLTANAAMGDGVALFHADHGNVLTAGVISESTIAEGIKKMKLQKDILNKRRLNINPLFVIAPTSLEGAAEVFFASERFSGDTKNSTRANIYSGSRFTRVYEARLDDDSTTKWYLAGPRDKTVKVYFLDGVQRPYLEMQNGWSVDGVEHKVRIDAGAKAMDWRGLSSNAGA